MSIKTRDAATFQLVQPASFAAYLRTRGWRQTHRLAGGRASVWSDEQATRSVEILLPLDQTLRDYSLRVADAVATLVIVEQRPQLEILEDVTRTMIDVVRVIAPADGDGRVGIDASTQLMSGARDMMMAAACAAVEKRTVFASRKPTEAVEYLRRVHVAPPERGSFVLTILSPVAPALQVPLAEDYDDPPFERKVTLTLAEALAKISSAAVEASGSGDVQPFFDGLEVGVHANLCDAVASLLAPSSPITIRVSWAPARPLHRQAPSQITFDPATRPIIQEASRIFRAKAPPVPTEIEGHIVRLERSDASGPGTVVVACLLDGGLRKVRVPLSQDNYELAIDAHKSGALVRCSGILGREGRGHQLDGATGVTIDPSQDPPPE